jgi:hypothetical protein
MAGADCAEAGVCSGVERPTTTNSPPAAQQRHHQEVFVKTLEVISPGPSLFAGSSHTAQKVLTDITGPWLA